MFTLTFGVVEPAAFPRVGDGALLGLPVPFPLLCVAPGGLLGFAFVPPFPFPAPLPCVAEAEAPALPVGSADPLGTLLGVELLPAGLVEVADGRRPACDADTPDLEPEPGTFALREPCWEGACVEECWFGCPWWVSAGIESGN
jgi:hypothetical protein